MANKMLFLSHIHEEKDLAIIIKDALEIEFSGFVDVFVSSDGTSIPPGSNFLKRIEEGLVNCIGALYLISPESVKRNWINFELGAVWIRNVISLRDEKPEIPTLPICHSGISPSKLPSPLNNLNAISANQSSQLEIGFQAIQTAVGGKGELSTDFDALAVQVQEFEQEYTIGANLHRLLSSIFGDMKKLVDHCKEQDINSSTTLQCGFVTTSIVQMAKSYESKELAGYIKVSVDKSGTTFGPQGAVNGAELTITIPVKLVLQFKNVLLA
ncbi:toll/interleukin-1 receptor domain-containing protein [Candidatus Babeliales bacterium]|nr:toll/interleukin-1 receptor domain-containing protein [Candidatus Babeliales bacterium]